MGRAIFKVTTDSGEERFLVWSSIVDAPVTFACTAEEIVAVFVEDAIQDTTRMVQGMLDRARETGSSSSFGCTVIADVVTGNRAGPGESTLTEDEIIEFYVRRRKQPTEKALAKYRKARG